MASSSLILPSSSWSYGPLHEACVFGDLEKLNEFLTTTNVNVGVEIGDRNRTPLHFAAEYGQMSILKSLLSHYGVSASASLVLKKDSEGNSPLHLATGNVDILMELLRVLHPSFDVNAVPLNAKKQTLLHYAAAEGNVDVVKFLLERGAGKYARDNDDAIPFHFAAKCGGVSVMELLVNEHDIDAANKDGETALHYASSNGRNEAVSWLLRKGASVSKLDKEKNTALHRAIISGSSEVIPILINAANTAHLFAINRQGQSPVGIAHDTKKDAAAVVKCVCSRMSHGKRERASYISIHSAKHSDGANLLHYAAGYATAKELESLILQMNTGTLTRREIVINNKDSNGNNLFHWAAMIGNHDVIETLQEYEVNPFEKNQDMRRPLCTALIHEQLEFARKLIQCLGRRLDLVQWKEDIRMWIGTVDVPLHRSHDEKLSAPAIFQILWKEKVETAKFIVKNTPWKGDFVNETQSDKTALQLATQGSYEEIVYTLCNTDEFKQVLVAEDAWLCLDDTKDCAWYCLEIEKELLKRPDVESYVNRKRQMHIQACSLIAVCASILAGGSFQALLNPLDNQSAYYKICLTMSFCCSIFTVLTVARALLPSFRDTRSVVEEMTDIGWSLFWAILLLESSLLTGFAALVSGLGRVIGYIGCLFINFGASLLLYRTSLTYKNKGFVIAVRSVGLCVLLALILVGILLK